MYDDAVDHGDEEVDVDGGLGSGVGVVEPVDEVGADVSVLGSHAGLGAVPCLHELAADELSTGVEILDLFEDAFSVGVSEEVVHGGPSVLLETAGHVGRDLVHAGAEGVVETAGGIEGELSLEMLLESDAVGSIGGVILLLDGRLGRFGLGLLALVLVVTEGCGGWVLDGGRRGSGGGSGGRTGRVGVGEGRGQGGAGPGKREEGWVERGLYGYVLIDVCGCGPLGEWFGAGLKRWLAWSFVGVFAAEALEGGSGFCFSTRCLFFRISLRPPLQQELYICMGNRSKLRSLRFLKSSSKSVLVIPTERVKVTIWARFKPKLVISLQPPHSVRFSVVQICIVGSPTSISGTLRLSQRAVRYPFMRSQLR